MHAGGGQRVSWGRRGPLVALLLVACSPRLYLPNAGDGGADVVSLDAVDAAVSLDAAGDGAVQLDLPDAATTMADAVGTSEIPATDTPGADAPDVEGVADVPSADVPPTPDAGPPSGYVLNGTFVAAGVEASGGGYVLQGAMTWYGVVNAGGAGYALEGWLQ